MSAKSNRHKANQAAESRLLDESAVEQRAMQIARDDGRGLVTNEDRARAKEELFAPNEDTGAPEVAPELGGNITAWDEAPGTSGTRAPKNADDDEPAIGKELVEEGMRGPTANRKAH